MKPHDESFAHKLLAQVLPKVASQEPAIATNVKAEEELSPLANRYRLSAYTSRCP